MKKFKVYPKNYVNSSKIISSSDEYYDEDESYGEDAPFEYMEEIANGYVNDACHELGYRSEPSIQGFAGSDIIYDAKTKKTVAVIPYQSEVYDVYDLYLENGKDYDKTVQAVVTYIENAVDDYNE